MRFRSWLPVIVIAVLLVAALLVFAQDIEPMANPACAVDQLGDVPGQFDELYTDGQTALQDGDVRTWLDNLRAMSILSSSLRAFCDGYHFEGDAEGRNSEVIGPVTFAPGIYTITATTAGYFILHLTPMSGNCEDRDVRFNFTAGDGDNGAQIVFRVEDEPCVGLLEASNLSAPWTLEFSLVTAG